MRGIQSGRVQQYMLISLMAVVLLGIFIYYFLALA